MWPCCGFLSSALPSPAAGDGDPPLNSLDHLAHAQIAGLLQSPAPRGGQPVQRDRGTDRDVEALGEPGHGDGVANIRVVPCLYRQAMSLRAQDDGDLAIGGQLVERNAPGSDSGVPSSSRESLAFGFVVVRAAAIDAASRSWNRAQ